MNNETLPGAWALVKEGYAIYHRRLSTIISIALAELGCMALMLGAVGAMVLGLHWANAVRMLSGVGASFFGIIILSVLVTLALAALGILLFSWVSLAMLHAIRGNEESLDFSASFKRARPQIWSFLWIMVLTALVSLAALLVCGVLPGGIVFGVLVMPLGLSKAAIAGFVAGAIGAAIAAVAVGMWFAFPSWILVDGVARGKEALRASYLLVHGRFWSIVGRFVLMGIGMAVVSAIVSGIIAGLLIGVDHGTREIARSIVSQLISVFFISPVFMAALYSLYRALRLSV